MAKPTKKQRRKQDTQRLVTLGVIVAVLMVAFFVLAD